MIKANGVAGVFLYANDPKKLAEWYTLYFGLEFLSDIADTYFMEFYYRDDTDISRRWSTVFAIMPARQPLSSQRGRNFKPVESPLDPSKNRMMAAIQEVKGCLAGSPIQKAITWSYTSQSRCAISASEVVSLAIGYRVNV